MDGELMRGKQPGAALVEKTRRRVAAYCAYAGEAPFPFTEERYDEEWAELLFPQGEDHAPPCSAEAAFAQILAGFLDDIRELFRRVLTNDPQDSHFFRSDCGEKGGALSEVPGPPVFPSPLQLLAGTGLWLGGNPEILRKLPTGIPLLYWGKAAGVILNRPSKNGQ